MSLLPALIRAHVPESTSIITHFGRKREKSQLWEDLAMGPGRDRRENWCHCFSFHKDSPILSMFGLASQDTSIYMSWQNLDKLVPKSFWKRHQDKVIAYNEDSNEGGMWVLAVRDEVCYNTGITWDLLYILSIDCYCSKNYNLKNYVKLLTRHFVK